MNKHFEDTNKDELGNPEGRFLKFSDLVTENKKVSIFNRNSAFANQNNSTLFTSN